MIYIIYIIYVQLVIFCNIFTKLYYLFNKLNYRYKLDKK